MQQLSPSEEMFLQAWRLKNPSDQIVPHFYFPEANYRVQFGHPSSQTAVLLESAFADQKQPDTLNLEQRTQRDLERRGWNFIRFTTEEVYNNPERCVAVVQDTIRRRNGSNHPWGYNSMPGGMYPLPPTPYGQPTLPYGQGPAPQPYGQVQPPQPYGGYQQPYQAMPPQPYQPNLPAVPNPYSPPMGQGPYQMQYQTPYNQPPGVVPYGPPYTRPGYRYEYDAQRGWIEKRPYGAWLYVVLPLFAGPFGVGIALLLACFKEPNPTVRTIARTLTVLGILFVMLAIIL